jgi:hypothetical protein
MRELADVEAELGDTAAAPETLTPDAAPAPSPEAEADTETATESPVSVRPQRPVSRRQSASNENDDADVDRLIKQANTEFEGPENRRRLSAIAHLKAAVVATVADRKATGGDTGPTEETRMNPYRSDLQRVVRPRRPETGDAQTQRAAGERPAPLMLVSELRIDTPRRPSMSPVLDPVAPTNPSPVTPVRPRRIHSGNLAANIDEEHDNLDGEGENAQANIFGGDHSFAEFAEQLGAESLPELLEAAAAYVTCVEGQKGATRPQLMRHVMSIPSEADAKRETLMRNFGTLLREGRIQKSERGGYSLNDASPVLAEARKITIG